MLQTDIAPGIQVLAVPDDRFQTVQLTAHFSVPLTAQTVAENALLPRLLARCCASYPDSMQFNRKLAMMYGAGVDGYSSVLGEMQTVQLSVSMLDDRFARNEPLFTEGLSLLCEMLFRPALTDGLFRAADLAEEKRRLAESIRADRNDLRTLALQNARKTMFAGEPYGLDRQGSAEQVEAVTAEQLTQAWKRLLKTARLTVILVGNGQPDAVTERLRTEFSAIDRAPIAPVLPTEHPVSALRTVEEPADAKQSKLVMGFSTTVREPQNTMPMRLAVMLYGGSATSRLFRNVREKQSLCYYCMARYDRNKGVMFVDSGVQAENAEKAQREILHQLAELQIGAFTDAELEEARLGLLDQLGTVSDSPTFMDRWYAAQNEPYQTPEEAAAAAEAVTRADIVADLQTWKPELVYLLKGEKGEKEDEA